LKNMKREIEIWKFINKKRGVRKWNENNIREEEWRIVLFYGKEKR